MGGVPGVEVGEKEGEVYPPVGPGLCGGRRGKSRLGEGASPLDFSPVAAYHDPQQPRRVDGPRERLAGKLHILPAWPFLCGSSSTARRTAGLVGGGVGATGHVGPRGLGRAAVPEAREYI